MYTYSFIHSSIYLHVSFVCIYIVCYLFILCVCLHICDYMWGFTGTVRALQEFSRDPILPEVQGFDLGFQVSLKYALKIMGRSM